MGALVALNVIVDTLVPRVRTALMLCALGTIDD